METDPFIHDAVDLKFLKYFRTLVFLAATGFGACLFYEWADLTVCFQRQSIVVFATLAYWGIRGFTGVVYLFEVAQFLILFIIAQKLNINELSKNGACQDVDDAFSKVISAGFFFLFGYHLGVFLAISVLFLTYFFHASYQRYYVIPQLLRERSIRGADFEELERIKFSKDLAQGSHDQMTCCICLVDFEEQEKIIKLPVCNHNFHQGCLQEWLFTHKECPYCRADVKTNQKLLKEGPGGRTNIAEGVEHNESNISQIEIV